MEEIRLQKFMAEAGVASRRKSEELILKGCVSINGKVVREINDLLKNYYDKNNLKDLYERRCLQETDNVDSIKNLEKEREELNKKISTNKNYYRNLFEEKVKDVNKSVEDILKLCVKLQISAENEDDMLDQDAITMLDSEIENTLEEENTSEYLEDDYSDDEFFEKVESLAANTKIGVEKQKTKIKPKKQEDELNKVIKEVMEGR